MSQQVPTDQHVCAQTLLLCQRFSSVGGETSCQAPTLVLKHCCFPILSAHGEVKLHVSLCTFMLLWQAISSIISGLFLDISHSCIDIAALTIVQLNKVSNLFASHPLVVRVRCFVKASRNSLHTLSGASYLCKSWCFFLLCLVCSVPEVDRIGRSISIGISAAVL